jgi:beta-phosphoglucomutase-like phosphatase (HAD superfamily)
MKYRCLILDHDDTVFDSGYSVHYQAFINTLRTLKPHLPEPDFIDFNRANFHLGFMRMCRELYGFDEHDFKEEYRIWKAYTQTHQASPFEGFHPLLNQFRSLGGRIAVASFSESSEIERDYRQHFNFEPDLIYAYDTHKAQLKPSSALIHDVQTRWGLSGEDILVIDDNPIGQVMALKASVDFIYATWSHQDPILIRWIQERNAAYESDVFALHQHIFRP